MTQPSERPATGYRTEDGARTPLATPDFQSFIMPEIDVNADTFLEFRCRDEHEPPEPMSSVPDTTNYNVPTKPSIQPRSHPPPPPAFSTSGLNMPPPPPPPPVHVMYEKQDLTTDSQRNAFIDKLEREQEDLRDIRDSVLGSRFRLRAQRSKLRSARITASAKDGSLFNMLRQYLHEHELPHHIKRELDEASDLRDGLGLLESGYDELEMEYDAQEWNYTRKESKFIEELVENDVIIVGAPHPKTDNLETADVTSFAMGGLDDLEIRSSDEGLFIMRPPERLDSLENLDLFPSLQSSEDTTVPVSVDDANGILSEPCLDDLSSRLSKRRAWAEKKEDIDKWLDDQASQSGIVKIKSAIYWQDEHADIEPWTEQVQLSWTLRVDGLPEFHTGDSTISDSATSHSRSAKNRIPGLEENVRADHEDHLAETKGCQNYFQPVDCIDKRHIIRHSEPIGQGKDIHQPLAIQPAVSIITDASPSRRSSTSSDGATGATSQGSCSAEDFLVQSSQGNHHRRESYTTDSHRRKYSEQSSQNAPATPTQQGKESRDSATPQMQAKSRDLVIDEERLCTVLDNLSDLHQPSEQIQSLADAEHMLALPHGSAATTSDLDPDQIELPQSPALNCSTTLDSYSDLESQVAHRIGMCSPPEERERVTSASLQSIEYASEVGKRHHLKAAPSPPHNIEHTVSAAAGDIQTLGLLEHYMPSI